MNVGGGRNISNFQPPTSNFQNPEGVHWMKSDQYLRPAQIVKKRNECSVAYPFT
jgi:hypothetical protein